MSDLSGIVVEQLAWLYAQKLEEASHAAYQARQAEEEAGRIRVELQSRLSIGEVVIVDDDTLLVMQPPKPGRRSVNVEGIHRHVEVLAPLGLGPEDDPRPRPPKYPTLTELERRAHVLEAYGVPLADLITVPPLGEPQIVVQQRKVVTT